MVSNIKKNRELHKERERVMERKRERRKESVYRGRPWGSGGVRAGWFT